MLSISDIVNWANERVCPVIKGLQAFGIGKSASKGDNIAPYVDDKYIGLDDTFKAQLYHKQQAVSSTNVPGRAYGDNEFLLQNTYQMAMIIFFNEKDCASVDKLYTFIQSAITGVLKAEGQKSIRVNVLSAILNDAQVWRQEYGNTPYKLSGTQRLIQINYNIVIVIDKTCIEIPNCVN